MNDFYRHKQYLIMTLDPLHVGTGGNRLGRVDNSIVREPGTKLPKIPGTALHGAIRQYAAIRYEKPQCAGSGQNKDADKAHCKNSQCPICYTFGYLKGQDGGQSGKVSISDSRILLFPVYSLAGPVWITCPSILAEFKLEDKIADDEFKVADDKFKSNVDKDHLNLGWLMLAKASGTFKLPQKLKDVPSQIREKIVLVSDKLFSQIVNSNLEVRTSVSINPETGAASDGALFTYEALPRATILWLDVIEDDFHKNSDNPDIFPSWPISQTFRKNYFSNNETWNQPLHVVTAGLKLAEMLGIGGMGTRGFGRVRLLNGETQ